MPSFLLGASPVALRANHILSSAVGGGGGVGVGAFEMVVVAVLVVAVVVIVGGGRSDRWC